MDDLSDTGPKRNNTRHEISYERLRKDGMVYTRALCCCGNFASTAFWALARAEDAAFHHLSATNYGKGRKDVWTGR